MAKEICISTTPHETRLAILEDDQLAEIYYERENEYTLAGSIYKGRVTRVLPGMQSSFVDVGLERDAFLYVTDFLEEQEDSEDYAAESNGRREPRPRPESGEEIRAVSADRSPDRSPDRPDRTSDRDRNGDRNRRPAASALPESGRESTREAREITREAAREAGREAARARREAAREQTVAPLREAVPATQDLEEKGDDESPEGTRRWRGRRGRRRGVRNGLPQSQPAPRPSPSAAPQAFDQADPIYQADQSAEPYSIPEPVAPTPPITRYQEPIRRESGLPGRDRGPRRPRIPYAQVSTVSTVSPLDRPSREIPEPTPTQPVPTQTSAPSHTPAATGARIIGGAIVLPGESLSKYGSAPAAPSATPAATTATVPKTTRPVNYVAPKPSTLVELPSTWDGGSVLPGETLSRYRATGSTSANTPSFTPPAPSLAEPPAHRAEPHFEAQPETPEPPTQTLDPEPEPTPEPAPELAPAPELVAAPTPELEAPPAEPEAALAPEPEPAEYEPENASVSYRVQPTGPSELRLPTPEAEEAPSEPETPSDEQLSPQPAPLSAIEALEPEPAAPYQEESQAEFPEFTGALAAQSEPEAHSEPAPQPEPTLQILHEDGTIEPVAAELYAPETPEADSVHPDHAPEPHTFELTSALTPVSQHEPTPPTDFAELVDRLQGFAPGHGLLEEETIDEEEYDFEPLHAHSDDLDQEDLEEETLDHQIELAALGEAVRDTHLEHHIHHTPEATTVEEESTFGYEEIEEIEEGEAEEDFEEEGEQEESAQSSQSGAEPQRTSRDDSRRGRGRSGSGGRNNRRNGPSRGGRSAQSQDLPIISELLKQGQEILVQIAKEPIAKKGARITSHIALPGRFLVFMPTVSHVGVSRKIASDEERQRLKQILISEKGDSSGGFIVRTAAEGASEEDLRADLRFLISLWTEIKQRSDSAKAPALIYHDLNLIERILRDQVSSNFSTIWVDSEAEYERIIRFLSRFQPQLVRRVKLYTKETPLFEHFGIQEEISKALKSKVWLKSGGSIVINQTEALVAIDINTGKYVGKTARLEDTIVKTNLDAIPEIVRQIRLRDLGGIIVIDFIDMDERKNRNRVLAALEEELKNDRAPSKVLQFNDFGLVAITRKRVKQSLERTLSVTCETCTGTGMVKSPITVCNEIYIEMRKMIKHLDGKDVMLRVHPEVVKQLKSANGKWINELEELVAKTIIIKSDPALHPEQFDIH